MKENTIGITVSTIRGLDTTPHYSEAYSHWTWNINFEQGPKFAFDNLCFLYMGKSWLDSTQSYQALSNKFKELGIYNNDKVAIIYDNTGIIAIGKNGEDYWLHLRDRFKIKTFKQLNLTFESLVVAC